MDQSEYGRRIDDFFQIIVGRRVELKALMSMAEKGSADRLHARTRLSEVSRLLQAYQAVFELSFGGE